MSVSIKKLLHLAFGIKDMILKNFTIDGNQAVFECEPRKKLRRCTQCKSRNVELKGTRVRRLRMVPLGLLKCFMYVNVHKYRCRDCGKYGWCKLPFAFGKFPMTQTYANYILALVKLGTIKSIAIFIGISEKTVKNIHKTHLKNRFKKVPYKKIRFLSIDEFSIRRGHTYMTVFIDNRTGRIVHAVKGRAVEDIRPFLQKLAKKATNLEAVAIDMSNSYISAIKTYLPKVKIVFDRFHVSKLLNEAVDEERRKIKLQLKSRGLETTKGERFLLLKNLKDLDDEEVSRLEQLFEINTSIAKMYAMKEQFRLFWCQKSKEDASKFLVEWILDATSSDIAPLRRVGLTILRHSEGLLNYYDFNINNGIAEGTNNKIKVLKRRGYGYNDEEYFTLLLYQLHEKQTALVG